MLRTRRVAALLKNLSITVSLSFLVFETNFFIATSIVQNESHKGHVSLNMACFLKVTLSKFSILNQIET